MTLYYILVVGEALGKYIFLLNCIVTNNEHQHILETAFT